MNELLQTIISKSALLSAINYDVRIKRGHLTRLPALTALCHRCADTLLSERFALSSCKVYVSVGMFLRCKLHWENQTILSLIQNVWSKCDQKKVIFNAVDSRIICHMTPETASLPSNTFQVNWALWIAVHFHNVHTSRFASRSHLWPTNRKTMLCGWTWLRASSNQSWTFWKERRLVMSNRRSPPTELR